MTKHQLIISNGAWPVRAEGQNKTIRTLVVDAKGTWTPGDHPERYLVVAPGDELEVVLSPERKQGGSLWIFQSGGVPLLEPAEGVERLEGSERVDFEAGSGSRILRLNQALAGASDVSSYNVRASALRQRPPIIVGEGQTGNLTPTRP